MPGPSDHDVLEQFTRGQVPSALPVAYMTAAQVPVTPTAIARGPAMILTTDTDAFLVKNSAGTAYTTITGGGGGTIGSANQDFGAFYAAFSGIATPAAPGAGITRLHRNSGTGKMSARTAAGLIALEDATGYRQLEDFGITVDDTGDNSTALSDARAALPAAGGQITLPAGTIRYATAQDFGLLKSLVGLGMGITKLNYTGTNHGLSIGDPASVGFPGTCRNRLAHFTITGPSQTTAGGIGIRCIKAIFPVIESVSAELFETGFRFDADDLWVASGLLTQLHTGQVKQGVLYTGDAGKQVNHMVMIGGYIYGGGSSPANAYGVKVEELCDTNVFIGTAVEDFNGTGAKGFWVSAGSSLQQVFIGTRSEGCTTDFLLDANATNNLIVGHSGAITDNGYANTVIRRGGHQLTRRYSPYGASITPDAAEATFREIDVLTGAITINNPTNAKDGMVITFWFRQDATGGRVVTWGSNFKVNWTPVTTAHAQNSITFVYHAPAGKWVQIASSTGLPQL